MNLSDAKKLVVGLSDGSLEDMTDPQFIRFLPRAIENRFQEVVMMCPAAYDIETTLTFLTTGVNVALPVDIDPQPTRSLWAVYEDSTFTQLCPGKERLFDRKGASLRFVATQVEGHEVFFAYTKKPTRYAEMKDIFLEENALEILSSEVQALFYAGIDENEPNASYSNSLSQGNRLAK